MSPHTSVGIASIVSLRTIYHKVMGKPAPEALNDSIGAFYHEGKQRFLGSVLWHGAGWNLAESPFRKAMMSTLHHFSKPSTFDFASACVRFSGDRS